jgi:hypothetical protein
VFGNIINFVGHMHAHSFCMNTCGSRCIGAHYHIMWATSRLNLGSTPFSAHFCFFSVQVARQEFPLRCAPSVVPNNLPPTRRDAWTRSQGWRFFGRKVKASLIQSNRAVRYESSKDIWCASSFSWPWICVSPLNFFFMSSFELYLLFTRRIYVWVQIFRFGN